MSEESEKGKSKLSFAEKIGFYVAVGALIISSFFSAYSIYQGSQNIEMTRLALETSIEPIIDISFPENYERAISFQNVSSVNLTEVRVFPVCYHLRKENELYKIIDRQPLTPVKLSVQALKPKDRSAISLENMSCSKLPKIEGSYVNTLVIVFRREADNKRFVKIEPFVMSDSDPKASWASSIYAEGSWSGEPSIIIGISEKIKETEAVIFRADK